MSMSNSILDSCHLDQKLSVSLAGVVDLIASEGRYHLRCYSSYKRRTASVLAKCITNQVDAQLIHLADELCSTVSTSNIFTLEQDKVKLSLIK